MTVPAREVRFTAPHEIAVRERPVPEPGPGEVRVRTELSAVSPGTELLVYRGEAPSDMAVDAAIDAHGGSLAFPLSYGYAAVGRVTAAGDEVADRWIDRRVFAFREHASHFTAEPDALVPVPDERSTTEAAFLANAECAVNFAMDGRPMVGERAAVFGQGVVGLLTTAMLARHPLARLVAVEPREPRRKMARRLGADEAVDPSATDPGEALRADGEGTDLAYELSGDPDALDAAIDAMAFDARLVVGSWYGTKRAELDLGSRFHRNRGELVSSQVSTIDPRHRGRWSKDRRLEVAWDHLDALDPAALVTHRLPVERAGRAYELLDERPDEALQVLLTYD